ncbi:MAG TPA: trans-4-hydroxy-L-proline dehydratase [Acidobacteriota bacterium]|nr:trans-4-hydroxy-L-proline dehydratase [Acidobacteriota bacterium]
MNDRTARLRQGSLEAVPRISPERASLMTDFYQANQGKFSTPVMRARSFHFLCEKKSLYLGKYEIIVGERGPYPKAAPTYPELTCHSLEDLQILRTRPKTSYEVDEDCLRIYAEKVIPYWHDRNMRTRLFRELPKGWHDAYDAGMFTEFMEQRAPGHTVLDGKIYLRGMLGFKKDITEAIASLDFLNDREASGKLQQLKAMEIACDAVILFAGRYAQLARSLAHDTEDPARRSELEKIADVCDHVPAYAPRDFHEALQYYWFCHLAVITELNGWDSFNPGHLDQHLYPFYVRGLKDGTLTKEGARELLECFFVKFNNHPAPPKVGVTAAESGTYTDFANINIGGMLSDGSDAVNEVSYLLLDIVDEMHLLQPSSNIQLSRKSPDAFLKNALRVLRKGYGFPSIFNADSVVEEQIRQGKTLEDARAGGCSGCVEVGAFGKEAYILTGYFNLVKTLEVTLHNGVDPATGRQIGAPTDSPETFSSFDALFQAYREQLHHFIDIKVGGNQLIERMYAEQMPAPFLSVLIDDCIRKGKDYNAGGARYNNTFIQMVGLGSITDCLSAIRETVYEARSITLPGLIEALDANFEGNEALRQRLVHRTHKYGNDDDYADEIMVRVFNACFEEIDGRPNTKGGKYRVEMLPTTCHVYFGSVTGAMPDGRKAGLPLSEGISPVQGADRRGPTAVIKSAAKMDHVKTGGTLLNMKFTPSLVACEEGIGKWAHLVRSYFKMDGHHVQFNVVRAETLREAQADPDNHRDLIVRVAGYSDYFCDLSRELQEEIITRTEHAGF